MAETKKTTAKAATEKKQTEIKENSKNENTEVEALKAEIEALKKLLLENSSQKTVVQVASDEKVELMFFGVVAEGAPISLGKMGIFNRAGVPMTVAKKEFFANLGVQASKMLESREVVVLSGLDEDEAQRYQVSYHDGEVLTQKDFYDVKKYDEKKLAELFAPLCPYHKSVVLNIFAKDVFEEKGEYTTLEKMKALKKICKNDGKLKPLVDAMLDRLGKEYAEAE